MAKNEKKQKKPVKELVIDIAKQIMQEDEERESASKNALP
jgi:hypothetical protein